MVPTADEHGRPEPEGEQAARFEPERIVEVFDRHRVDYLIVGGVGVRLHGARRVTLDFDALASFARDNLERLCVAMRELNARIRAEGFSDAEAIAAAPAMVHPDTFNRAELTTWLTDAGPLDVLHDIPDRDGTRRWFEELAARSTEADFGGVRVRVAALDDIVNYKEWANLSRRCRLPTCRSGAARRLARTWFGARVRRGHAVS